MNIIQHKPITATRIVESFEQVRHDRSVGHWSDYFNVEQAVSAVRDHVRTLPSSTTNERHTERVYMDGIKYFLAWYDNRLPSPELVRAYINHLKHDKRDAKGNPTPLKASTISSKYLAPLRKFIEALSDQIIVGLDNAPIEGKQLVSVTVARDAMRAALKIKNPAPDTTSIEAPLDAHGTRLKHHQVDHLYSTIDPTTKRGARDLALLYIGFTTGLRLNELRQISLSSFVDQGSYYQIRTLGKRNNTTPVACDRLAYALCQNWVNVWNEGLSAVDERLITFNTPLWQPIVHGDNYPTVGIQGYTAGRVITTQAIRDIVQNRTAVLFPAGNVKFSPHDMRRTLAYMCRKLNMPIDNIQVVLRHKSIVTTKRYIGNEIEFEQTLITNRQPFTSLSGIKSKMG